MPSPQPRNAQYVDYTGSPVHSALSNSDPIPTSTTSKVFNSHATLDRAHQVKAYLAERYAIIFECIESHELAAQKQHRGYNPLRVLRNRIRAKRPFLHRKSPSQSTGNHSAFSSTASENSFGFPVTTLAGGEVLPLSQFPFGRKRRICEWEVENHELRSDRERTNSIEPAELSSILPVPPLPGQLLIPTSTQPVLPSTPEVNTEISDTSLLDVESNQLDQEIEIKIHSAIPGTPNVTSPTGQGDRPLKSTLPKYDIVEGTQHYRHFGLRQTLEPVEHDLVKFNREARMQLQQQLQDTYIFPASVNEHLSSFHQEIDDLTMAITSLLPSLQQEFTWASSLSEQTKTNLEQSIDDTIIHWQSKLEEFENQRKDCRRNIKELGKLAESYLGDIEGLQWEVHGKYLQTVRQNLLQAVNSRRFTATIFQRFQFIFLFPSYYSLLLR
jgi:hypothetical protein